MTVNIVMKHIDQVGPQSPSKQVRLKQRSDQPSVTPTLLTLSDRGRASTPCIIAHYRRFPLLYLVKGTLSFDVLEDYGVRASELSHLHALISFFLSRSCILPHRRAMSLADGFHKMLGEECLISSQPAFSSSPSAAGPQSASTYLLRQTQNGTDFSTKRNLPVWVS